MPYARLSWKTWDQFCELFVGDEVISADFSELASDTCGEEYPYINQLVPNKYGHRMAYHGDFVLKRGRLNYYVVSPKDRRLQDIIDEPDGLRVQVVEG